MPRRNRIEPPRLTNPAAQLLALGTAGVRTLRRPDSTTTPAFDLTYVRRGPRGSVPIVVVPGGPGLASIVPYRALRRWAAQGGLDIVMVEHRGVGLSRTDVGGAPLPFSAMWITEVLDDLAAVLDHECIERAVIVGSSYGSFLASSFGARYPERVAGMVLDSALQSTADLDIERAALRARFWDADSPEAALMRSLVDAARTDHGPGSLAERQQLDVARAAYELGGNRLLRPLLAERRDRGPVSSPAWSALLAYAGRDESIARVPGIYEFDCVGAIAFRELNYGAAPDGLPLDPALTYQPLAAQFPAFAGEPYDLTAAVAGFDWPMVLLSGTRDLRTPPAIAQRVAALAPSSVLVSIRNGHSALDTNPAALLNAARRLVRGEQDRLPALQPRLDRLPRRGVSARLPVLVEALLQVGAPG